jgi:hypothetical protein
MAEGFNETLNSWQTFYFTAGGAAAALIGLMFVALSLGTNMVSAVPPDDYKAFVTPSVFYFASVLMLALVMLIPAHDPLLLAFILFAQGVGGLVWVGHHVRRLIRVAKANQDFNLVDWLAQVLLPIANFVLLPIAALGIVKNHLPLTFTLLCLCTLSLLFSAIANTWSLVIWIIEKRRD